jgi:hypothetical protein
VWSSQETVVVWKLFLHVSYCEIFRMKIRRSMVMQDKVEENHGGFYTDSDPLEE